MEVDGYESFQLGLLFWLIVLLFSGFLSPWGWPLSNHKNQDIVDKNNFAYSTLADFLGCLPFLNSIEVLWRSRSNTLRMKSFHKDYHRTLQYVHWLHFLLYCTLVPEMIQPSFQHIFIKCLQLVRHACGSGDRVVTKTDKIPSPSELIFSWGEDK